MCIKRQRSGFTLIEMLIAVTITALVVAAGAVLAHNFMRSVAFLTNAVELDAKSRLAIDNISREIRQCDAVLAATTNMLALRLGSNVTTYVHDPEKRELTRALDGGDPEVYLSGCDYLRFDLFQRNPLSGRYDDYPGASPKDCKVVQLNWVCSRYLLGFKANSTTMQSAKVVIRKK